MDDRKQGYMDLLNKKLELLLRMLELTQKVTITGEGDEEALEKEAEQFYNLYENRDVIVTKIQKIDKSLAEHKDLETDREFSKTSKPVLDKMKKTARVLIELDKKNIETSQNLTGFLKGNLKKIRDGRDISNKYGEMGESTSGYYFDRTK